MGFKKIRFYLGVGVVAFLSLFLCHNTFASSVATSNFDLNAVTSPNGSYYWINGLLYGQNSNIFSARQYQFTTDNITPTGNYASLHFETNIVGYSFSQNYVNFVNQSYMRIYACSSIVGGSLTPLTISQSNVSTATTTWTRSDGSSAKTLTVYGDIILSGLSQQQQQIVCGIGSHDYAFFVSDLYNSTNVYFEQNPINILYTNNANDQLLQTQINQNTTIINQNQQYYDSNYNAVNNIDNQSTSDIQGATNSQTTNIIGTIQNFATALGTVTTTPTGACVLTLPFPSYAGGEVTVNVCQKRGTIQQVIAVSSSLLVIGFFIPFAFFALKMIYNEIRSWTNG